MSWTRLRPSIRKDRQGRGDDEPDCQKTGERSHRIAWHVHCFAVCGSLPGACFHIEGCDGGWSESREERCEIESGESERVRLGYARRDRKVRRGSREPESLFRHSDVSDAACPVQAILC